MSAEKSIDALKEELSSARRQRTEAGATAEAARQKEESLGQQKTARTDKLHDLSSRFANLGRLTSELNDRLQKRRDDAGAKEEQLAALESRMGLGGIDVANAVKPETQGGNSYDSLAAEYSSLKAQERAGEIPNGTAQAFYNKNRAVLNPRRLTSAEPAPLSESWGEKITRGSAD